jgi:hypothetical protein
MDFSELVNGKIRDGIRRLQSFDEVADHSWIELGASFSIATLFSIKAVDAYPFTSLQGGAIQHCRQFFVGHPDLRHPCPLKFDGLSAMKPTMANYWHEHFNFGLVESLWSERNRHLKCRAKRELSSKIKS